MPSDIQQTDIDNLTQDLESVQEKLGLSISPNVTAIVYTQEYINGEGTCRITLKGNNQSKFNPPKQEGQRMSEKISGRAVRRIRRACRVFQYIAKKENKICAMITLTFGKHVPDDVTAKILLDRFLKRYRRHKHGDYYLWVAEKQKRGAIHFHILTGYTDKEFINKAWNAIVNKWQIQNNFPLQKVLPHVKKVDYPSSYFSKYITKNDQVILGNLYGMSQNLSHKMKPIKTSSQEVPRDILPIVIDEAVQSVKINPYIVKIDEAPFIIYARTGIHKLSSKIEQITNSIKHE